MSKIIIDIAEGISDFTALVLVEKVVKEGKISNDNTCYCFGNRFDDGSFVSSYVTKTGINKFIVTKGV